MFANPQNFSEAYGLATTLLRFVGLFPYEYDLVKQKFRVSWKYLSITAVHVLIYAYVNVTSIMENWRDYSQPMIGHSSLSAMGNLVLRLLGIVTTFFIMTQPLLFGGTFAEGINMYIQIVDEMVLLGLDVTKIYRRIYYLSSGITFLLFALIGFNAWHSSFFYEHITERPPELKYYLVVTLTFLYKILFLYYGGMQLFGIYMISNHLNQYLNDLKQKYLEIYDLRKMVNNSWRKEDSKMV